MKFKAGDIVWSPHMKDLLKIHGFDPFEHSYQTTPLMLSSIHGKNFYAKQPYKLIKWETLDKNVIQVSEEEAHMIALLFG